MKILWPVKNRHITNDYGERESFRLPDGQWTLPFHYGVDFAQPAGTPIYAVADGKVKTNGWDNSGYGGGWEIAVDHGNGWVSWYLHRFANTTHRVGQTVKAGDVLGHVGSTGASTGPHLHFELHKNGNAINPAPHFVDTLNPKPDQIKQKLEGASEMLMIHRAVGKETVYAIFGANFWLEFSGSKTAGGLLAQITGTKNSHSVAVSDSFWNTCKKSATTGKNK